MYLFIHKNQNNYFEFALNKFLNLCNEVKIINVMGDEIPLYNFIKNIDLGRKQYA